MRRITRRRFLQYGIGAGSALALHRAFAAPQPDTGIGRSLTKYIQAVPVPGAGIVVATPSATNAYSFTQRQILRQLHPHLPPTPIWAYDDGSGLGGQAGSFGMAIAANSGTPLRVSFTPALPDT